MNENNPIPKSEPTAEEIAAKAALIRKKWSKAEYFRRAADRMPANWDQELANRPEDAEEQTQEKRPEFNFSESID